MKENKEELKIISVEETHKDINWSMLFKILTTKRGGESISITNAKKLPGCYYLEVGSTSVGYACHIDTVHHSNGKQSITIENNIVSTPDGECLGADDGAGMFVLFEMIRNNIPGRYFFFEYEESGGVGVQEFVNSKEGKKILSSTKYILEFDRKGTSDVVYYHSRGSTAKKSFAFHICQMLGRDAKPSDTGVFTDICFIKESFPKIQMVNIAIGYQHAHSPKETLDLCYLAYLIKQMISKYHLIATYIDDPKEKEEEKPVYNWRGGADWYATAYTDTKKVKVTTKEYQYESYADKEEERMIKLVRRNPEAIARILFELGYSSQNVEEEIAYGNRYRY